jgi:hypothetical protein
MISIRPTIPGGATDTLTNDEIGFSLGADYNARQLSCGDWCVIAPAGLKADTTPAFGTVDTRNSNGARLNFLAGESQPFDAFANAYDAGLAHDPDTVIRPGDVLWKMKGVTPTPAEARDGVAKQFAALRVVTSFPTGTNPVSPAVWTGSSRPWDNLDIAGVVADLPSYSAVGTEVTWASIRDNLIRRNPAQAMAGVNENPYQDLTPNATGDGSSNYSSYQSIQWDKVRREVLMNRWSTSDKEEALFWMALIGYDCMMAFENTGINPVGGGHSHWFGDHILLAIKATGKTAQYSTYAEHSGSLYGQYFLHTAGTVAKLTAGHSVLGDPYISRIRDVTSVASDTELVVAHDQTYDQNDKTRFQGGIAVRVRDGAERTISTSVQVGPDNNITGWTWTFSSALTGTTTADDFWVKAPFAVTAGMPDWAINGTGQTKWINPLAASAYRQEVECGMALHFAHALGMVGDPLGPWDAYVRRAMTGADGLPNPVQTANDAFVAAYGATVLALPQIV